MAGLSSDEWHDIRRHCDGELLVGKRLVTVRGLLVAEDIRWHQWENQKAGTTVRIIEAHRYLLGLIGGQIKHKLIVSDHTEAGHLALKQRIHFDVEREKITRVDERTAPAVLEARKPDKADYQFLHNEIQRGAIIKSFEVEP